ncbi:MAG TPA: TetR/AcrR family transcriptional regulator [Caulobacteraceae bacterium]|nr:TetR/AcrR family transcriptional regulator [Caulobacteraceae bacterium]
MPKITETKREERRQQILDAALRCFSRDGFHATTTADIVRESGLSQGALYLYFATKDDIVVALADDRHQGEVFLNALAKSEQDPVQGLLLLIELYGRGLTDQRRIEMRRVGIQGWAEALRNPRIHDSVLQGFSSVRAAIAELIRRGQATGQIRPDVEPDAAARTMIAVFQGLVLQLAWGEDMDLAACGTLIRGMIRNTLFTDAVRAAESA